MRRRVRGTLLLGSAVVLGAAAPARAGGTTERVSVSSRGVQGDGNSGVPVVSADGRFVAFWSYASDLVPGDTNGVQDVFVRDLRTGRIERADLSPSGAQTDGEDPDASFLAISAHGRFVAFGSGAGNLVEGDTNGREDVFVRDRRLGTTERVSVSTAGAQANGDSDGPAISGDGRFVAFVSSATDLVPGAGHAAGAIFEPRYDVFLRDRLSRTTEQVDVGLSGVPPNGGSGGGAISNDGRFVAFQSDASNLVEGDTGGGVYVRDRLKGTTERVDLGPHRVEADGEDLHPAISADGRFVAFLSWADNLVAGDTNGHSDVFVRDRLKGRTERVSVASDGTEGGQESGYGLLALSADGRFVIFDSDSDNLVPDDTNRATDVFVRDRVKGTTARVSVGPHGRQGDKFSTSGALSADGRLAAFFSQATNLVPGDANRVGDVFVRTR